MLVQSLYLIFVQYLIGANVSDTVASYALKMESDWPPLSGDLFDEFSAPNNVVSIFDRPAMSPDRHAQLETPQPRFIEEQQWAFPTANEPSSDDLLTLASLSSEDVDRLLSETTEQPASPAVVAEEEGVLRAVSHDHDYVEQVRTPHLCHFSIDLTV